VAQQVNSPVGTISEGDEVSRATPSVSIVVPAYNAAATMQECLRALNDQTWPRDRYEVIVVDDGSTDATNTIARQGADQVLRQANSGAAVARNAGIAQSHGAIVLFTDADCAPARDWIEKMLAPLASPEIAGSKGVYRTRQTNLVARFIQVEYEDRYDHTARKEYVDFIDTYAAGYRRTALEHVGGFSMRFPNASNEDQELSFRITEAGYRMKFSPGAVVYHHHPESWRRYALRKFKIGYWKALVIHLHPQRTWRDSHTPDDLKAQMILTAVSLLLLVGSRWHRNLAVAAVLALLLFVVTAFSFVIKAWRRDRLVAAVCLPALYLRAWSLGLGLVAGKLSQWSGRGALARALRSDEGD
jgi:cellulose synthase/poly-beta-1,6-N-acetylglucosamine synthase-like glycosyltransferase